MRAIANPIPLDPPVTNAARSATSSSSIAFGRGPYPGAGGVA
jgi:hypothetical protein